MLPEYSSPCGIKSIEFTASPKQRTTRRRGAKCCVYMFQCEISMFGDFLQGQGLGSSHIVRYTEISNMFAERSHSKSPLQSYHRDDRRINQPTVERRVASFALKHTCVPRRIDKGRHQGSKLQKHNIVLPRLSRCKIKDVGRVPHSDCPELGLAHHLGAIWDECSEIHPGLR